MGLPLSCGREAAVAIGQRDRVLVGSLRRAAAFPDVPTIESVIPGYESESWYGMFVPSATPRESVTRIHAELAKALRSAELREFMTREGGERSEEHTSELQSH